MQTSIDQPRHSIPKRAGEALPDKTELLLGGTFYALGSSAFSDPNEPLKAPHFPIAHEHDGDELDESRYALTRGVFAIPIMHDNSPDAGNSAEGLTIALSHDGATFELATTTRPATAKWLLGIEDDNGQLGFKTVVAKSVSQAGLGLRVSAAFVAPVDDPLSDDNLTPMLNKQDLTFHTKLPQIVLNQWVSLGVLKPQLIDRVLVCRSCGSLPTLRRGCRNCGSVEVKSQRLIHHFACAHVDHVSSFDRGTELACPKCLGKDLVVGSDFEYLAGPLQCPECQWSDTELLTIARCGNCGDECSLDQTVEKEMVQYRVKRLESLALVTAN
ncbi:hypothetical protein SAMN06265222_12131 [Neorhodopirellula lusitana]|uniref:Thaumarchaeal output domain-containing protein n=1 Tax=Neorhodopirellula lusitana TaxID=445327 RepID=A0ABY1QR88_9BACT|nr:hypothetical protein [Neorhodopirellula lusitana]SMP76395.1 hypothetical protein SAMN06265222_12131 [Neorhodopirellula lusitana]